MNKESESSASGECVQAPPSEAEDYEPDVWECEWCDGDGMDPMSDYCLECPHCGGMGSLVL